MFPKHTVALLLTLLEHGEDEKEKAKHHSCRFRDSAPQLSLLIHLASRVYCNFFHPLQPTSSAWSRNLRRIADILELPGDCEIGQGSHNPPDHTSRLLELVRIRHNPSSIMADIAEVIDLPLHEKDHLNSLPPELVHMIISYLFPTHKPDIAFEDHRDNTHLLKSQQPLEFLAATCRTLRAEVNDWAETFLRQHQDITRYQASVARTKGAPRQNWLRGRGGLLWWSERNCVFCRKATKKTAIFMNALHCCQQCDDVHWPKKITKTAAIQEFHLTGHHLLPHRERTPIPAKLRMKGLGGLPTLKYGTLMTAGVPTTLFLSKEVEALARVVHGDLEAHLAKRKVEKQERREKRLATGEKNLAKTLQWIEEFKLMQAVRAAAASNEDHVSFF